MGRPENLDTIHEKRGLVSSLLNGLFWDVNYNNQNHRTREGKFAQNYILKHVVIKDVMKLLVDPTLNCSDPQYKRVFFLDFVGFRLENAGLL